MDLVGPPASMSPTRKAEAGGADEVRDLLRVAIAAAVGGGRRADTLPERADAARDRRPAWLRLCLGGGASFPRGVFPLALAGSLSRRGQPAHPKHSARPWHPAAHDEPSRPRRRARGR